MQWSPPRRCGCHIRPNHTQRSSHWQTVSSVYRAILPPDARIHRPLTTRREQHCATAVWEFETEMRWDELLPWKSSNLEGTFKRTEASGYRVRFRKVLTGDMLILNTTSHTISASSQVQIAFFAYPFSRTQTTEDLLIEITTLWNLHVESCFLPRTSRLKFGSSECRSFYRDFDTESLR